MFLTRRRAYARPAPPRNPSDGYHGKTISFSVPRLLRRSRALRVGLGGHRARGGRSCAVQLRAGPGARRAAARVLRRHPAHQATIKRFVEYCHARTSGCTKRNFSVRYQTTIPRQVGLAGSSALIVATLRCLMEFYQIEIPLDVQPTFV